MQRFHDISHQSGWPRWLVGAHIPVSALGGILMPIPVGGQLAALELMCAQSSLVPGQQHIELKQKPVISDLKQIDGTST